MMKKLRVFRPKSDFSFSSTRVSAAALALFGGACSADISRLDSPGFSLASTGSTSGGVTRPMAPMRSGGSSLIGSEDRGYSGGDYGGNNSSGGYEGARYDGSDRGGRVQVAALPDVSGSPPNSQYQDDGGMRAYAERQAERERGRSFDRPPADRSPAARNHGRTRNARGAEAESSSVADRRPEPAAEQRQAAAEPAAPPKAGWEGTHTMAKGDSLYGIARRYNVKISELQDANGISNPRNVRPGTVLRVPGGGTSSPPVADASPAADSAEMPRVVKTTTQPVILNSTEQKVAALPPTTVTDAAPSSTGAPAETPAAAPAEAKADAVVPPLSSSSVKLRWPVRGRVVDPFGQRADGTHNDGINIAVPMGTEVHAAEAGTVAYAGNELAGYGNLVLIRHDNGWVTAYGYNDELLVKRGDTVTRGQILAKAGKSGGVDQPQLHFEVRQDQKPVDPTPFMDAG